MFIIMVALYVHQHSIRGILFIFVIILFRKDGRLFSNLSRNIVLQINIRIID